MYLQLSTLSELYAVWIKPLEEFTGIMYLLLMVGSRFDYHGYSEYEKLIANHKKADLKYPQTGTVAI